MSGCLGSRKRPQNPLRHPESCGLGPPPTPRRPRFDREIMAIPFVRWSNLSLIARREMRDQFRDRRTLFMIFVLPLLLYPMIGFGFFQFAAAQEQKPLVVILIGAEFLANSPP